MVAAIKHPRPEVYPKPISRGLTVLNALLPGFTDRFVRKYGRRRVVTGPHSEP